MIKKENNMFKKEKKRKLLTIVLVGIFILAIFSFSAIFLSADPTGPAPVVSVSNETKNTTSSAFFNISGGYIAALNLTANVQNVRWKAFVGWVNGKFTLDDQGGSTIYDWSLSVTSGRVYSTRDSSTIEWNLIQCANSTTSLAAENTAMFHNATSQDNLTRTFQYPGTHDTFWVAGRNIGANACPTLNTYTGSAPQDDDFEEMALYDSTSIIYATILEDNLPGYDGQSYDFQMLVPENGSQGFTGATAYYLYVELD
jgi:hypothetical protein